MCRHLLYAVQTPADGLLLAQAGDMIRDGNQKYVSKDLMAALKLYEDVLQEVRVAAGPTLKGHVFVPPGGAMEARQWTCHDLLAAVCCCRAEQHGVYVLHSCWCTAAGRRAVQGRTMLWIVYAGSSQAQTGFQYDTVCWPLLMSPAERCHSAAAAGSVVRRHSCACCLR